MPLSARFVNYAIDFEAAYVTGDWSRIGSYFTSDAIYCVRNSNFDCEIRRPGNIIAGFKRSVDGFDRKLKRSLWVVDGPDENQDSTSFIWHGVYRCNDCPPLSLSARQTACYRDGLIERLTDEYLPGCADAAANWLNEHKPDLDPSYREGDLTI